MPKLYRPCMLLKYSGNRLQLESPLTHTHRISGRTFGILAAALSALGCAAPALSRTLAGSLVLYINSAAARLLSCRLLPDRGCAGVKGAL